MRSKLWGVILSVVLFFSLSFPSMGLAQDNGGAGVPTDAVELAQKYINQTYGIAFDKMMLLGLQQEVIDDVTRETVAIVNILDTEFKKLYKVVVQPSGQVVPLVDYYQTTASNHQKKYGKLDPALYDLMQAKSSNETTKVAIWLKSDIEAVTSNLSAKYADAELAGIKPSKDTDLSLYKSTIRPEIEKALKQAINAAEEPVKESIRAEGFTTTWMSTYAPVVFATLPPQFILELGARDDVSVIYDAEGDYAVQALDKAASTIGAPHMWNSGYDGTGIRVAIIDIENVDFTHDNLVHSYGDSNGGIVGNHPTGAAGIIASDEPGYWGIAPGATLIGASSNGYADPQSIIATIEWALLQDVQIVNISLSFGSTAVGIVDRYLDYVAITSFQTVVVAAGSNTVNVHSPALGYNGIAVGAFDDNGNANWTDDSMWSGSGYTGPRDKPELAGPGVNVHTTITSGRFADQTGTSFAAPVVSGEAALLMQQNSILQAWPELSKAIIMTSALHNIEGDSRISDVDGVGGISAKYASSVLSSNQYSYGTLWKDLLPEGSFSQSYYITANAGDRVRAVLTWDSHPGDGPNYDYPDPWLSTDLDLFAYDPNNNLITYSNSFERSWEIIEFNAPVSGQYYVKLYNYRMSRDSEWYGLAWDARTLHTLTVNSSSGGTVSTPGIGTLPPYSHGEVVYLEATPYAGYQFLNWSGPVANPTSPFTSITMNDNHSIQANFILSDTTPPVAVTNLAVDTPTQNSLRLTWTAPGDDGNTGTATLYDVRYSTSPITAGNWASATQASGEPTPLPSGSAQSFMVNSLSSSTTYYFALKTADEVPNWSSLSNNPSGTTSAPPDNFPSGWGYRKQFTINGSSGGAQTNYQMKLNVYKSTGTDSGGSVYLNNHSRDDFADVRFTKSDGTTLLDHWKESYVSGSSAVFWVEFDLLPVSPSSSFYIYYGNSGATSASNGANTFPFFDDFSGLSLDGTRWATKSGTATVTGGEARLQANTWIYTNNSYPYNQAVRAQVKSAYFANTSYNLQLDFANIDTDSPSLYGSYALFSHPYAPINGQYSNYNGTHYPLTLSGWTAGAYHTLDIERAGTTSVKNYVDNANEVINNSGVTSENHRVWLYSSINDGVIADWVLVRKYVSPEPTWGTWGSETSLGGGFPSGWGYRKQITINGSSSGAQTNYQMKLNVYKGTGTDSGGSVYLNNHSRDDFADVRVTKADGTTLLDHWQESYVSGSSAVFWIEFDSIPASPSTASFYIYYGNPGASSVSSGDNTLLFFDDFLGPNLDTAKWTNENSATVSVANSIVTITSSADAWRGIHSNNTYGPYLRWRTRAKGAGTTGEIHQLASRIDGYAGDMSGIAKGTAASGYVRTANDGTYTTADPAGFDPTNYHILTMLWNSDEVKFYQDDVLKQTHTANIPNQALYVYETAYYASGSANYVDWIFLGKYVSPEPAWGTWGSETGV